MKCIYCAKRPNMVKKTDGNHNWWWECPICHKTVGKKEEKPEEQEND